MQKELTILDDQTVLDSNNCSHGFKLQADVKVEGIIYDIYFCEKCLLHVKKERPCPTYIQDIK